jgi:hypothetical protein
MIIAILIYVASALIIWNWFRRAYSANGIWSNLDAGLPDVLWTFFPVANTVYAIMSLFMSPLLKEDNNKVFNKFFRVWK